jgi:hypothetical protein
MSTAILFLVVFQAETARTGSPPLIQGSQMNASRTAVPGFAEESSVDEADYEARAFIQNLNELSRALTDFAANYKSGQVDVKKVKAVRKALHELEKSEWFRPQKAKK